MWPIARVVGIGSGDGGSEEQLDDKLPGTKEGIPYIGQMYTRVRSALGLSQDPSGELDTVDVKLLKSSGYTYWALGHVHQHQRLAGMQNAWYPGSFMGLNPEDAGLKGGLIVTLNADGTVSTEFKSFVSVIWYDLHLNQLAQVTDVDDLFRAAEQLYYSQQGVEESMAVQLVRLTLSGMCPIAEELQSETRRALLEEKLAEHLNVDDIVLHMHQLTPLVDIDMYRDEPHLLSEVLKVIETASEDSILLNELASQTVARHLEGADRELYLSKLLSALDREAIVRLTREDSHAY